MQREFKNLHTTQMCNPQPEAATNQHVELSKVEREGADDGEHIDAGMAQWPTPQHGLWPINLLLSMASGPSTSSSSSSWLVLLPVWVLPHERAPDGPSRNCSGKKAKPTSFAYFPCGVFHTTPRHDASRFSGELVAQAPHITQAKNRHITQAKNCT